VTSNGFETRTIGDLLDGGIIAATTGFPCGDHNQIGSGIPHVRPFNVGTDGEIHLEQVKSVPTLIAADKPRLQRNDIVFNNTNTKELVGKCALWSRDDEPVFSNHMTRIRVIDESCDPAYLSFAILHHWMTGKSEMLARTHVAQASIIGSRFGEIEIAWRELRDQQAIASVLVKIRLAIRSEAAQLLHTRNLKRAVMGALFVKGLRGEQQKESEIGPIPASWEPRSILDVCEIWSGGTPRKSVTEYWNGDIPWASGKDLKTPVLTDTVDHVSTAGVEAGSRIAPAGAVLVLVRGMGLAKDLPVGVTSRPMAFNQDVKALVSRGEYSGHFIRSAIYVRKERLLSQIVPSAHGTMTLNLNDIETFKLACPTDPKEADDIADVIGALDRKIDLHRQKRYVLEKLFNALLHNLMVGTVRVRELESRTAEVCQ
jgi:type I restriction enzyme S subunit